MLRRSPLPRDVYMVKPPTGIRFSNIELQQIAISILVLALAFKLLFSRPFVGAVDVGYIGEIFLISLVAVVTGFLFHELAHKMLAQKYGCWAEYRMSPFGLIFAIITAVFGFVFAAPGAVHISGYLSKEQSGRISAAGPMTNAVVGGVFLAMAFAFVFIAPGWARVPHFIAFINFFLAGFNMIPIPPFDGSKVIYWNKVIYALIMATIIVLGAITYLFVDILVMLGF